MRQTVGRASWYPTQGKPSLSVSYFILPMLFQPQRAELLIGQPKAPRMHACPRRKWQKPFANLRNHTAPLPTYSVHQGSGHGLLDSGGRGAHRCLFSVGGASGNLQTYVRTSIWSLAWPMPHCRVCNFKHPLLAYARFFRLPVTQIQLE